MSDVRKVEFEARVESGGTHVIDVFLDGKHVYTTDSAATGEAALKAAQGWLEWRDNVANGAESIYYILAIPVTWPGPAPGAHAYSGLHFKIGRTNDVRRRVQNLRTGTSDELIVHALEPGSPQIERMRHEQFRRDRRQGEWFAASPELCAHVMSVWGRHLMLPPEDQQKIAGLPDRIRIYRGVRKAIGGVPDMVNPSLGEPWNGSVFIDLVYRKLSEAEPDDE